VKESQIQDAIREALAYDPDVTMWRINPGMATYKNRRVRTAPSGMSDLIGVCKSGCFSEQCGWWLGRFIALEVKTEKGKTTQGQDRFLDKVRELGGFACVVRSVDDALEAVARCKSGHLR